VEFNIFVLILQGKMKKIEKLMLSAKVDTQPGR